MSKFIGTIEEFKKFLGGYCRNTVRNLTAKEKQNYNSICFYCGRKAELDSAHVRGQERIKLIEEILKNHFENKDEQYIVDMAEFERLFLQAHTPVDDHFHFLCHECHTKYDRNEITELDIINHKLKFLQQILQNKHKKILIPTPNPTPAPPSFNPPKITTNPKYDYLYKKPDETVQNYVKRLVYSLRTLEWYTPHLLSLLQDKDYCKQVFYLSFPLLNKELVQTGPTNRYYVTPISILGEKYYICSQWWKLNKPIYIQKLNNWVYKLIETHTAEQD